MENDLLNQLELGVEGNPSDFIEEIRFYSSGKDSVFSLKGKLIMSSTAVGSAPQKWELDYKINGLSEYLWVAVKSRNFEKLTSKATIWLEKIIVSGKAYQKVKTQKSTIRPGISVRNSGDDDVHTYRIPGLATGKDGSLLAIYDVRRSNSRDLQGDMDIGLSRSMDGGLHWEKMQIVLDMEEYGDLPEKFNGVSDASILVDKNSGDVFIAGLWMHGIIGNDGKWVEGLDETSNAWNHQWRNKGSQPGLGVRETSQFLIVKSKDNGKTWSKPVNITSMAKKPEWRLWAPAPGNGITLSNGILVFPSQGRDNEGHPFSNITYSKDGGATWETSHPAASNTTECAVVELSDGRIMLNMRDNRNRTEKENNNGRNIAVSNDLGMSWSSHPSSHHALIEPVCMGSLIKHEFINDKGHSRSILLFSNPNDKNERKGITIKVSLDNGLTWPEKYWIELDSGHGFGYSSLTSINDETIGILYEGSKAQMTFQAVSINEILKN
ncbi:exo-alpha-sialidase [Echinicola sediminis]